MTSVRVAAVDLVPGLYSTVGVTREPDCIIHSVHVEPSPYTENAKQVWVDYEYPIGDRHYRSYDPHQAWGVVQLTYIIDEEPELVGWL